MTKPYNDTRVPFDRSLAGIQQMLTNAGVENIRITDGQVRNRCRVFRLEFIWPAQDGIPELPVQFELELWQDLGERERRENRRSGRFLYWLIKSKVENVKAGFRSPLQEFVGEIIVGGGTTLQQVVEAQIRSGEKLTNLELLPGRLLPETCD